MNGYAQAIEDARAAYGAAASSFMPDTCAIKRYAQTSDGQAGTLKAYSTVADMSAVPCSYRPASGYERATSGAVEARVEHVFTMPVRLSSSVTVDVKAKDRIVLTARGSQIERTFEVVTVRRKATALSVEVDVRSPS